MKRCNPLYIVAIISPFMLWGMCMVLPVFDDWYYHTAPKVGVPFSPEALYPMNQYWRPFDVLFGYALALRPSLFPLANHLCIFAAHAGSTVLVYRLAQRMRLSALACCIATLFFFISPAALGTLLNTDSLNQAFSGFFGLVSLYVYTSVSGRKGIFLYVIALLMAALCKENGLAWAAVTPIFGYAVLGGSRRRFVRGLILCAAVCAAYFAVRLSLQQGSLLSDEFVNERKGSYLKYIATWLSYTWLPVDYIAVMFKPERNWGLAALTAALGLPFLTMLSCGSRRAWQGKRLVGLLVCFFAATSPHLVTVFGNMHCYSGLPMAALIAGCLLDGNARQRLLAYTFGAYAAACMITDLHHWQMAKQSGQTGEKMAKEIVAGSTRPARRAMVIHDGATEGGFSTFCTPPLLSFEYGLAVKGQTGFSWPEDISDTIANLSDAHAVSEIAARALASGTDAVWMVSGDKARVIAEREQ